MQSAHRTDSKFLIREFFSQNNQVFRGFVVSGLGATTASVSLTDSTLVLPQNTTDFSYFAAPTGAASLTVLAASLTNNTRNFLELQLSTLDGTPLSKVFWDSTANSGSGAEFSQVVNTVTDLVVTVSVLTTAFSGSVNTLPLAIVDVDNGGLITSIFDRRNLFGRLAKPANLANEFAWGTKVDPVFTLTLTGVTGTFVAGEALTIGGETATVVAGGTTSITFNKVTGVNFFPGTSTATGGTSGATGTVATFTESFVGVDKNIHTVEDVVKALMTEMKKIKGTSAWYEDAPGNLSSVGIPFGVGTNAGANVQIATFAIPFTALTKGMHVSYSPDISIGATATLNVDGLGARAIVKHANGTLASAGLGDIVSSFVYNLSYNGVSWVLDNPTNVAQVDVANVITANQRINAGLGVNVAPPATGDFAISGSFTGGIVPDARLTANVAIINSVKTISGIWTFSANPIFNANAIADTALSTNVALLNGTAPFTANQRINAGVGVNIAPPATGDLAISGSFSGGIVPLARMIEIQQDTTTGSTPRSVTFGSVGIGDIIQISTLVTFVSSGVNNFVESSIQVSGTGASGIELAGGASRISPPVGALAYKVNLSQSAKITTAGTLTIQNNLVGNFTSPNYTQIMACRFIA